jgi:DNA-binding GntR family transcriptional regulator
MASKITLRSEKEFRSITRLIAEELRSAIVAGKIAPGERLIEEQLAGSLKVGRVPLRDALRRLEAEGYVTAIAHDQFAVSKPTVEDVEDYYSIAGALEGLATRLAIERASDEEIARLAELHQLLRLAYRERNLEQYFEANRQFHRFIAEMARNDRLYRLISEMRQEIRKTRLLALERPQRMDYSMREHDQILDAFLKRNPELAESTVLKHLNNQMIAIKQALQATEGRGHA